MSLLARRLGMMDRAPATDTYDAEVMADSPIAYWRLGDTAGTTADETGTHPGTVSGATRGQPGALTDGDTSFSFDGVNDRVVVTDHADFDLSQLTLEAWVRDRTAGFIVMQGHGGGSSYSWGLYKESGSNFFALYLRTGPSTVKTTGIADPGDGAWHHIVGTYDGQILRFYLDGSQAAVNDLGTPTALVQNAGNVGLSAWVHSSSYSYAGGDLDEVAVYGSALSASRIAAHYAAA